MKYCLILLLTASVALFASCRTEGNLMLRGSLGYPKKYKPEVANSYIQLENGRQLPITAAQEVEAQHYIEHRSPATLVLRDTTIRLKDMRSLVRAGEDWQTQSYMYGIRRNRDKIIGTSFATMALKGPKINYYVGHSPFANATTTRTDRRTGEQTEIASVWEGTGYYIQKGDSGVAARFGYKQLRSMIPTSDPASKYLVRYSNLKKVSNAVRWAGFGSMVVGAVLLATGKSPANDVGGKMLLAGLPILTIGGIMQSKNIRHNLHHAFYLHNGMAQ